MVNVPRFLVSIAFLGLLGGNTAVAGPGVSGGGDVIVCKTGIPVLRTIFGWHRVYLADTFSFFQKGGANVLPLLDEKQTLQAALETLDSKEPGMGTLIGSTISRLEFREVEAVEELDDDNIVLDIPSCQKQQLAIQDIFENRVRVNKELLEELTPSEKVLFRIHEAYIHIRNAPPDTTPIRAEVRAIIESPSFEAFLNDVVPKVTTIDILKRIKKMLLRECNLSEEPLSLDRLARLGCHGLQGFETPIEAYDFVDLHVDVIGSEVAALHAHGTVGDLRDYIWSRIPKIFKQDH